MGETKVLIFDIFKFVWIPQVGYEKRKLNQFWTPFGFPLQNENTEEQEKVGRSC